MRKLRMHELNRLSVEEFKEIEKIPVVIVLDNIRSLLNVGSVFRTSDAFKVSKVFLCGVTATPPHKEMEKTALGATESMDWEYSEQTITALKQLKQDGYTIYAVEQTTDALQLHKTEIFTKSVFVFGNEVKGVSTEALELCDHAVEIPQFGTKHSLNISVSAGIVMWHAIQSFIKK